MLVRVDLRNTEKGNHESIKRAEYSCQGAMLVVFPKGDQHGQHLYGRH